MADVQKCMSCLKIIGENYGNMQDHPCLACIEEERMRDKIVCCSGGFDPSHIGHLRYLKHASEYGKVVVLLNSDEWLMRKKGFVFMPFLERKEMLEGLSCVHAVIPVDDEDGTVCKGLIGNRPDYFAKGGDRGPDNTPEQETCGHLGIEVLFGIGGDDKLQASSKLVEKAIESKLIAHGIVR